MTKEQIMAFVRLLATMTATCLTMVGISMDADTLYIVFGMAVTVAAMVWAWWKNNNLTDAAQQAQEFLALLKSGDLDRDGEEI